MSFNIVVSEEATKEIKRIGKKYRLFKIDFAEWLTTLEETPTQGEPLGKD